MDSARHVIGCYSTRETRVHRALDDVANTIHQSLPATHIEVVGVVVRLFPLALLVRTNLPVGVARGDEGARLGLAPRRKIADEPRR